MQFDADTKATGHGSHLVTFGPRPEPEIEDDAQAKAQDVLGEAPDLVVELLPGRRVPRAGSERDEPFILCEAQGAPVRGELPCERRFTRPGQPAGENQSGFAHSADTVLYRVKCYDNAPARGIALPPDPVAMMLKMVDEFLPAEFTSSMARDVAGVRPPEVGRLNGAVVRFGDAAGIATPANARIRNELLPLHLRCRPCR